MRNSTPSAVQLHHVGRGHTNGDTLVYFPDLRVTESQESLGIRLSADSFRAVADRYELKPDTACPFLYASYIARSAKYATDQMHRQ